MIVSKPKYVKQLTKFNPAFYSLTMTILTSLFTALIAAGTFIKIPMVPVSMTLQTLFVFLSGLLLPPVNAALSILLYIILGLIGLPIFTSGGGPAALLSPTGGFIIGFLFAAFIGSLLSKRKHDSILYNILVVLVMEVVIYLFGLVWLKYKLDTTWRRAFAVGFVPFIIGDAVKLSVAAVSGKLLYPEIIKVGANLKEREKEE